MGANEKIPDMAAAEHFEPYVGKLFHFRGARHTLTLDRVIRERQPPTHTTRPPFTLIFRGPKPRDVLPEGFYECEIEGGPRVDLYLGPIHTPASDRQEYQAVFN